MPVRRLLVVAVTVASLALILVPDRVAGSIGNCGLCVCERQSITCDADYVKDRIRDSSVRLEDLVPSGSTLRAQGLEPAGFEDLYINCKGSPLIQSRYLRRALLNDLVNLKKVAILKCGLVGIEPDAFDPVPQLEDIDVSDNSLEVLPLRVFASLKVKLLKLSENRKLRLEADPVRKISLQRLVLTKCDLTEFPTAALASMDGLTELTLSENRIRFVPRSALTVVTRLKVFYFDENPLECTCANKWLRESVNWEVLSPAVMRKSKQPTCKSPFSLMDIELTKLEPSRFLCTPPRISRVDVSVQRDHVTFACAAQADERNDQPLAWFYQRSLPPTLGIGDIASAALAEAAADRGPEFSRRVARTPGLVSEQFAVRVANSDGQSAVFNLTIAWPPELPRLPSPPQQPQQPPSEATGPSLSSSSEDAAGSPAIPEKTAAGGSDRNSQQRPPEQPQAADSSKQFTLLEMIIAVIGTFMSTSLVFLLACQFVRWYKRRDKKLWASYAHHHHQQQAQGHQATPHPQYTATYNYNPQHPASSHEYDVPRIDQPCLPKPPPPPPMSQLPQMPHGHGTLGGTLGGGGGGGGGGSSMSSSDREFLDYNNPKLMYNV